MMRPDYQAELLLSFQKERAENHRELMAASAEVLGRKPLRARFLSGSGTVLIMIGSRLQRWSGVQTPTLASDAAQGVVWQ